MINKNDISAHMSTEAAEIYLRKDGIMHVHIMVKNSFELQHSMQIVEARTKLAENKPYPILYTTEHTFVTPSPEVKQYVASEERSALVLADAFVIKSLPQRLAAKMFSNFNKPVRPSKFFSNEADAILWLKEFVSK